MPTENRSSNTEMVSVPPFIGLEPLVGRYYPARCRRCGWVGSSEELTEDDAQCTRDVGDRLCLGDCDELQCDDLLRIIQAMSMPVQQHQGEPVAFEERVCSIATDIQGMRRLLEDLADKRWPDKDHDLTGGYVAANIGHASAGAKYHLPALERALLGLNELLHTQADAGEVEQLRLEIAKLQFHLTMDDDAKIQGDCIRLENTELRAQLAERDQLLGSAKSALCHLLHNIKISGKRIDLGLAKDSADTVITLINALQAEAKS